MSRTRSDADANFKLRRGDLSAIPAGEYCYTPSDFVLEDDRPRIRIQPCAYWGLVDRGEGGFGYCALLKRGDDEHSGGMLHDMVKECGHNLPDYDIMERNPE